MILLLDVMDTLVYDPFHSEVPNLFGLTLDALLEAKHPDAWQAFERGEWDEVTFAQRYFRDARPVDPDAFRACLGEAYRWLDGVEQLLADLSSAGVVMHALSNYPPWYRLIEERLQLSRYVAWTFVSCDTGLRKPDPRAYLNAARSLDVAPSECLFVDDRPKNVLGAEAVGMPALQFEGADSLRAALGTRNLL